MLFGNAQILKNFGIINKIDDFLSRKSALSQSLCVVVLDDAAKPAAQYKDILRICWYAARLSILQRRVGDEAPEVSLWLEKLLNFIPHNQTDWTYSFIPGSRLK